MAVVFVAQRMQLYYITLNLFLNAVSPLKA